MKKLTTIIYYFHSYYHYRIYFVSAETLPMPKMQKKASRKKITYQHKLIAYQDSPAIYDFIPTGSAAGNRRALNHLISSDKPKIININNEFPSITYLRRAITQQSMPETIRSRPEVA